MHRGVVIRVLIEVYKMKCCFINRVEEREKQNIGVVENSVVDCNMEMSTNVLVIVYSNLRVSSRGGQADPLRMDGEAKYFNTIQVIDVGNMVIGLALDFLKE